MGLWLVLFGPVATVSATTATPTPTPTPTARHCVQGLAPQGYELCCAGCSPSNVCVSPLGDDGCFMVVAPQDCCWRAHTENFQYLTVVSGSEGCGNENVCYRASANYSTSARVGAIAVDDHVYRVGQNRYPTPDGKADLVVDRAYISIPGFTGGCRLAGGATGLSLHVCITNRGTRSTGSFDVQVNDQFFSRVDGVDQGAVVCALGRYTYPDDTTVVLDSGDEVDESNETNNTWTRFVPIPTLPPTCTPTAVEATPATPGPSPTPTGRFCPGDCNGDGRVAIDELVLGVNVVLERETSRPCPNYQWCRSGLVCIPILVEIVGYALHGCWVQPGGG